MLKFQYIIFYAFCGVISYIFLSSRRRHTRLTCDWSSDVCSSDLFAHHGKSVGLGVRLDRMADVAKACTRPHLRDAAQHALVRDLYQALRLDRRLADKEHPAGIAMVAVLDDGHVDVDDVAFLELLVAGNAVAHLVVDRGADGARETLVVERRRNRLLHVDDIIMATPVERIGGHARLHVWRDHFQHLGREPARDADFLEFFRAFQGDGHNGQVRRITVSGAYSRGLARY